MDKLDDIQETQFPCNSCEKKYSTKKAVQRHKRTKHGKVATDYKPSATENTPLEFKGAQVTPPTDVAIEPIVNYFWELGPDCFLRKSTVENCYLLQRRQHTLKISTEQITEIIDIAPTVEECLQELLESTEKKVQFMHHLGNGLHVSIYNKYPSVDFRKFVEFGEGQKFPTKTGVCLPVSDFHGFVRVLQSLDL